MDVSENSGTPKSSILIEFSIINHPFWGTTIFGTTHIVYGKWQHLTLSDTTKSNSSRKDLTVNVSPQMIMQLCVRWFSQTTLCIYTTYIYTFVYST